MDDCAFWKQWIDEVKYDLQVVPGKLENLHKKYSAQIIAMDHLYPMTDVKKTLSNCLYAFKATGNAHHWDAPNLTFYNDLQDQLEEDTAYQQEATVDRFFYLFVKTATQWELQHGQEPNP